MITFERFEAAKIRRFVFRYKKPYTFSRSVLNAYEEPKGSFESVCTIDGVYHEASYTHLASTESDGGRYVKEITPMILCLKNAESDLIKEDDVVVVNDKDMVVTKVKDINNSGFALDISLRFVDDGSKA